MPHIMKPLRGRAGGFTAIELMTTVGVLAVLVALAAPSFSAVLERWRVREAAEALQSTLYYARSEAIKRGGNVTVKKIGSSTGCTAGSTGQWDCGWQVVATASGVDEVLRVIPPPTRLEIRTAFGDTIFLNPRGLPIDPVPGWVLTPKNGSATASNRVCFSQGGLIKRLVYNRQNSTLPAC